MTSVASAPTQTQPDPAKANKTPTTSTTANKFDIPTPEGLTEKDFDDAKTVVGEEVTPEKENKFRTAVEKLRDAIEGYNTAVDEKADQKTIEEHEQKVVQALKETAESSPNPQVKEYYKAKVLEFMKVGSTAKKYLTNDLIKGSLFILASPIALLSSVLVSTGGLVYGLGSVVKGVGDLMSGMTFSGTVLGSKDEPKPATKDEGVGNEEEEAQQEGEGETVEAEDEEHEGVVEEEKVESTEGQGANVVENAEAEKANKT